LLGGGFQHGLDGWLLRRLGLRLRLGLYRVIPRQIDDGFGDDRRRFRFWLGNGRNRRRRWRWRGCSDGRRR
jgi:hypothetical protein